MRLINHWNSFSRGTLPFPPLKVLNSRWDAYKNAVTVEIVWLNLSVLWRSSVWRGLQHSPLALASVGPGFVEQVRLWSVSWNVGKQRLWTMCEVQKMQCRTCGCMQMEHSGAPWAPAGVKHIRAGCWDGEGFAPWFILVCFSLSFPVAPMRLSDCCLQTCC